MKKVGESREKKKQIRKKKKVDNIYLWNEEAWAMKSKYCLTS